MSDRAFPDIPTGNIVRRVDDPPEDWGHDDCTVCETAREMPWIIVDPENTPYAPGDVVELEGGQICRVAFPRERE